MQVLRSQFALRYDGDFKCRECTKRPAKWSVTFCESFSDDIDTDATSHSSLCDECFEALLVTQRQLIYDLSISLLGGMQDIRQERREREVNSPTADDEELYQRLYERIGHK